MTPIVLVHPALPAFEPMLSAYTVVHAGDANAHEATAAVTVGSYGLSNDLIAQLPQLKLIACLGVGIDGLDLAFTRARGIAVTNGQNINQDDVADVAIGLLIGVVRRFHEGQRVLYADQWRLPLAVPPQRRISGLKLGIVGMGAIGRAIARRAEAMLMQIAWTGPHAKPDVAHRYEPDLHALALWADVLALALPGGKATDGLVSARILEALGPDGILINIARGSIVDEDALIAALKAGKLGGAGLDVFVTEPTPAARWADVPNVMLTPHLGGGTRDALIGASMNAIENLRRFFAGEGLLTPVS
ncbi:MAG: 2-hydroxyacid dehydrogenase [Pseudomonadota bacterium]